MREAVIVSAVRTPVGKFQGSLQPFTAPRLGALVVREAMRRAGVDPAEVDECIMGCVIQAGLGQNPARQASLYSGMRPESAALTINQVCGSGLRAAALAAQAIQTGNAEILVAGGMEDKRAKLQQSTATARPLVEIPGRDLLLLLPVNGRNLSLVDAATTSGPTTRSYACIPLRPIRQPSDSH